jgi:hypothetical protein
MREPLLVKKPKSIMSQSHNTLTSQSQLLSKERTLAQS